MAAGDAEVAVAIHVLSERVDTLAGRVVGVETAHRTLAENAQGAVRELLVLAQGELGAQSASLGVLRDEVAQEGLGLRFYLGETRDTIELSYASSRSEFDAVTAGFQDIEKAYSELMGQAGEHREQRARDRGLHRLQGAGSHRRPLARGGP